MKTPRIDTAPRLATFVLTAIAVGGGLGLLAACTDGKSDAQAAEEKVAREQQGQFLQAQPVPVFNWSQLRQNLIELETTQAQTTATTTFFFNMGTPEPISSCPSIGYAIPATFQLTNPSKIEGNRDGGYVAVEQIESTGVYTGDTTGTYVMCVDDAGEAYAFYWEGFVATVAGPAEWRDGQVVLTGTPSFDFSEGQ